MARRQKRQRVRSGGDSGSSGGGGGKVTSTGKEKEPLEAGDTIFYESKVAMSSQKRAGLRKVIVEIRIDAATTTLVMENGDKLSAMHLVQVCALFVLPAPRGHICALGCRGMRRAPRARLRSPSHVPQSTVRRAVPRTLAALHSRPPSPPSIPRLQRRVCKRTGKNVHSDSATGIGKRKYVRQFALIAGKVKSGAARTRKKREKGVNVREITERVMEEEGGGDSCSESSE